MKMRNAVPKKSFKTSIQQGAEHDVSNGVLMNYVPITVDAENLPHGVLVVRLAMSESTVVINLCHE